MVGGAGVLGVGLMLMPAASGIERFDLENGLRVTLRDVPGAKFAALMALFDVGERHDPEGRSGMAHLVEHLLVTAPAGGRPARTADEWFRTYSPPPLGCNAQTGEDYTLLATVFRGEDLAAELAALRDRMSSLEIRAEDLARELPRLEQELGNMFGGIPDLAARNLARELLRPSGEGFRRGGLVEQLRDVPAEEVAEFHARYYGPRNARLVIVGDLDPQDVRAQVEELFAEVPAGEAPPPLRPRRHAENPGSQRVPGASGLEGRVVVARAYPVPTPESEHYAAFLVFLSRLFREQGRAGQGVQFTCAPVDDPFVMFLSDSCASEAEVPEVLRRMDGLLEGITPAGDLAGEVASVSMAHAWMLGGEVHDFAAMNNPYGIAFGLGRGEMLGIRWPELEQRLGELTPEDLHAAAEELFGAERPATVILVPGG